MGNVQNLKSKFQYSLYEFAIVLARHFVDFCISLRCRKFFFYCCLIA